MKETGALLTIPSLLRLQNIDTGTGKIRNRFQPDIFKRGIFLSLFLIILFIFYLVTVYNFLEI